LSGNLRKTKRECPAIHSGDETLSFKLVVKWLNL
jgi:hypothetical protein